MFHRRIFVDAASGLRFFGKLALLKRRKGLIFILAGAENPKGNSVAKHAAKLGWADQILYTQGALGTDLQGLGLPASQLSSDATVIEAIMNTQAAKTKRAVARKGTQTSGSYR